MRGRVGKAFWEKIEKFLEDGIELSWSAFREGMNSDDTG